jgi:hypothetical protein
VPNTIEAFTLASSLCDSIYQRLESDYGVLYPLP